MNMHKTMDKPYHVQKLCNWNLIFLILAWGEPKGYASASPMESLRLTGLRQEAAQIMPKHTLLDMKHHLVIPKGGKRKSHNRTYPTLMP